MGAPDENRRLSAILAADVAGYTRLVERDTQGTVAAWRAARDEVFKPAISRSGGRLVKLTGDGFLAEFSSVEDAVGCAVAIQRGLTASPLDFRIGVSLGDIIDDGEDIHGEGVNIAARIEALAQPGGICISDPVFDSVRNRIHISFEDFGEHEVKHVARPIRVWRWGGHPDAGATAAVPRRATSGQLPRVAVLPLDNLSRGEELDEFCDGLAEDLITELSRQAQFETLARNTMFAYRGRNVPIATVGQELQAQYVLEGSVRRSGSRVRVTAQLIAGATENHVWANRYDRDFDDGFELQEELSRLIAIAIATEIAVAEREQDTGHGSDGESAADLHRRGLRIWYQFSPESNLTARALYEQALALEPQNRDIKLSMAWTYINESRYLYGPEPEVAAQKAYRVAVEAVRIDRRSYQAHYVLGLAQACAGNHALAEQSIRRSLELNPNETDAMVFYADVLIAQGKFDEGIAWSDRALTLNPEHPSWYYTNRAYHLFRIGRYAEAMAEMGLYAPGGFYRAETWSALCLIALGRTSEANAVCDRLVAMEHDDVTWRDGDAFLLSDYWNLSDEQKGFAREFIRRVSTAG